MTKTITRRDIIRLASISAFATAAGLTGARGARAADAVAVRLGNFGSPNPQTLGRLDEAFAAAMGEGAKLDYLTVSAAPQIISAMAGGDLDICNIGASPFVSACAADQPISMVYVNRFITDSEALAVQTSAGIDSVKDLVGKTVGVPFNTTAHYALTAALQVAGVEPSQVRLLNMKPDAIFAAWQQRAIDAAYIWRPILNRLVEDEGKIILTSGELQPEGFLVFEAIIVRDAFKDEHPELVDAYLSTYIDVVAKLKSGDAAVYQQLSDFLQLPVEAVESYVAGFQTLTPAEVVGPEWMGAPGATESGVLSSLNDQLKFLYGQNQVMTDEVDFTRHVDATFAARLA